MNRNLPYSIYMLCFLNGNMLALFVDNSETKLPTSTASFICILLHFNLLFIYFVYSLTLSYFKVIIIKGFSSDGLVVFN